MWPTSCWMGGLVQSISCRGRALLFGSVVHWRELRCAFREMSAKNRILLKINHTVWCRAIIDILGKALGAFRKTMKSDYYLRYVCMSVCLSAWNIWGHWKDFHEILYLNIFRKSVEKIQVSLKSDQNRLYFT